MYIKLYTDGACSGNPGPGGYGCILSTVLQNGQLYETRHSCGYRLTTNNRMELLSVVAGLSHINGQHDVEVISDSKYVCDAFNQHWINNWIKNGWKKGGKPIPNVDLWRTLWNLVTMQNTVKFTWVKGHSTNPYNNACDEMAVMARLDASHLEIDTFYENSVK